MRSPIKIHTTGIEQYLPGGSANIKMMVIGGAGVGKSRSSAGWPSPIYLNVEGGLASVAAEKMPYVDIDSSDDMLQALKWLKRDRDYGTVIVDTLDAFQRKVKQEWLDANPDNSAFSGYDAWGYLDTKMQMLMTRLLSLDKHVLVLVHYKDKTYTEKDEGGNNVEIHEFMLQLQGDIKDTAFNDFDLVGWIDTYWKADKEKGRVQRRGITFTATPSKPILKDRLHITDEWMPITLETGELEQNYLGIFSRFMEKLDELEEGGVVGEMEYVPEDMGDEPDNVSGPAKGGPVAPSDPKPMPLMELTKAELLKMAKGMPAIADEVKTTMLKAEVAELIESARRPQPETESEPEVEASSESEPEPKVPADTDTSTPVEEEAADEPGPESNAEGIEALKEMGATEVESEDEAENEPVEAEKPVEQQAESSDAEPEHVCSVCGKDLANENRDYVRLAYIKFREKLCNEHFKERKEAEKG